MQRMDQRHQGQDLSQVRSCFHGCQVEWSRSTPAAPVIVEKPTKNGDTITLEQVKKVAQTIKTLGGFQRMTEVLAVIKELGGVKRFKDLAEAMTVPSTDEIPF